MNLKEGKQFQVVGQSMNLKFSKNSRKFKKGWIQGNEIISLLQIMTFWKVQLDQNVCFHQK
jgi:hypothetical protein